MVVYRYVLLCEWERVLPDWPWIWASRRLASEARLILSQVVDRAGRVEAWAPLAELYMYRLTMQRCQFRVFCESVPWQILLLGPLVIPGAARRIWWRVLQCDKKSGAHHIAFNHQRSTRSLSKTQNVCKSKLMAWRDGAKKKAHNYYIMSISARNTATWTFFLSTTIRQRTFLKPTGID